MSNHNYGREYVDSLMNEPPKFGATGKFPKGKIDEHDEGEIRFGIAADPERKCVHIDFGTPVVTLAMQPDEAVAIAEALIANARKVTQDFITVQIGEKLDDLKRRLPQ